MSEPGTSSFGSGKTGPGGAAAQTTAGSAQRARAQKRTLPRSHLLPPGWACALLDLSPPLHASRAPRGADRHTSQASRPDVVALLAPIARHRQRAACLMAGPCPSGACPWPARHCLPFRPGPSLCSLSRRDLHLLAARPVFAPPHVSSRVQQGAVAACAGGVCLPMSPESVTKKIRMRGEAGLRGGWAIRDGVGAW